MSIGIIILIGTTILIFSGLSQRALDRLRLNDKQALLVVISIIFSTFFLPDIKITDLVYINIGGAIIPLILVLYLFIKAGTKKEKLRAIVGGILSGFAIYLAGKILSGKPESFLFDLNILYGITGGIIAYILGRSRRSAFIAGVLGVIFSDIIQFILNIYRGYNVPVFFGGAGAFDSTILAGVSALFLAETIGEFREKIQGGTNKKDMKFEGGEFTNILDERVKIKRDDENEK
ncbi:DUF1614 domain-containing protein [Thermohalobacter berrensis]|uniref:DUF1614 domain-containing protein n=1 Tax=Thermohalobacter berrensis TaxID=99594 RepID=A0A419TA39_9FIRM|nr:DUF1614 domain-containing protein [Thermohalobacter berrensis]RKD34317.1 hypothetical protein BET03_00345 [Thermohalobacter berrensis]